MARARKLSRLRALQSGRPRTRRARRLPPSGCGWKTWSASGAGGAGDFAVRLRANEAGDRHRSRVRTGRRPNPPRRRRIQSQERRTRQRVLLLLLPPHAGVRPPLDARGSFEVSGEGWLDREWSSSALASVPGGLGLVRVAPFRRQRIDALPASAPGRERRSLQLRGFRGPGRRASHAGSGRLHS